MIIIKFEKLTNFRQTAIFLIYTSYNEDRAKMMLLNAGTMIKVLNTACDPLWLNGSFSLDFGYDAILSGAILPGLPQSEQ